MTHSALEPEREVEAVIDGDWVKANQTTLGSDNGIGIAAIMAILESQELKHGPLEALFTVSEETTMAGAFGLNGADMNGRILLNLDSEDEGELFIGCAGGIDLNITWNCNQSSDLAGTCYKLNITGLKGGHSGIDINLGRANANKVMLNLLKGLSSKFDIQLVEFSGGDLRNAIPREAEAIIKTQTDFSLLNAYMDKAMRDLNDRYNGIEDKIVTKVEEVGLDVPGMDVESQNKFMELLLNCPDGVIAMSEDIPGVVQTSNNLAIIKAGKGRVEVKTLLRSSYDKGKMQKAEEISNEFIKHSVNVELSNGYPGWLPDINSKILRIASATYKNVFNSDAKIKVIHAGLECGIIGDKIPGLDMISFGPTIRFPHSPDEKVNIQSVGRFWTFLKALLETIE